jgi:hypothetical protein
MDGWVGGGRMDVNVRMYVCTYARTYICKYVCMCVNTYLCMHTNIYRLSTYIHVSGKRVPPEAGVRREQIYV